MKVRRRKAETQSICRPVQEHLTITPGDWNFRGLSRSQAFTELSYVVWEGLHLLA